MKYVFTECQFQIFLAASETENILCFSFEEKPDDQKLIYELVKLVQQGRLIRNQNKLEIAPDMKWIVDGIKQSDYVLRISCGSHEWPDKLVYTGSQKQRTVLEKQNTQTGNVIKAWASSDEDLIRELMEDEMLADTMMMDRSGALELEQTIPMGKETDETEGQTLFLIEKLQSKDGANVRTIHIYEDILYRWIDVEEEEEIILHHIYSGEEFCEILWEELRNS